MAACDNWLTSSEALLWATMSLHKPLQGPLTVTCPRRGSATQQALSMFGESTSS